MDITVLHPALLEKHIHIQANPRDVLLFHSFVTHGSGENHSHEPVLCCFPIIAPVDYLSNPLQDVLSTYLNGTHSTRYAHFYTGNKYKFNVRYAETLIPHIAYPLGAIGKAFVGAARWNDQTVVSELYKLFNEGENQQADLINTWLEHYTMV
jgi:hypothetical protein